MSAIFRNTDRVEDERICGLCDDNGTTKYQPILPAVQGHRPRRVHLTCYEEAMYEVVPKEKQKRKGMYRLKVTTGNKGKLTCRAKFSVRIKGICGETEFLPLVKTRSQSVPFTFSLGSKEVFCFTTAPLDALHSFELKMESEKREQLFLKTIELSDISAKLIYTFSHNDWLVSDKCEVRTLEFTPEDACDICDIEDPPDSVDTAKQKRTGDSVVSSPAMKDECILYRIAVNDEGQGALDGITVKLTGNNGSSKEMKLMKKSYSPVGLRSKEIEVFFVRCKDLGTLRSLALKSAYGSWSNTIHSMFIIDVEHKVFYFVNLEDQSSSMDEIIEVPIEIQPGIEQKLDVRVMTGNRAFAGTDSNIQIVFFSLLARSNPLKISDIKKELSLERGSTKIFQINTAIGPIKKIRLTKDMVGKSPDWFLEKIEIEEAGYTTIFPCRRWIPNELEKDEDNVYLDIYPAIEDAVEKAEEALVLYDVRVETGNVTNAGTDANVFISLIGSRLTSREIQLDNGEINFDVGEADNFKIKADDVGELEAIDIRHDNTSLRPSWFLKKVVVKKYHVVEGEAAGDDSPGSVADGDDISEGLGIEEGRRDFSDSVGSRKYSGVIYKDPSDTRIPYFTKYTFKCNRWLAEDEEDEAISLTLKSSSAVTYYKDA